MATDRATIAGLVLGFGAVLGGQVLEGGHLGSVLQPTAALIVIVGTFGAVAVQFSASVLLRSVVEIREAFRPRAGELAELLGALVGFANRVRRDGLLSIEGDTAQITDDFFREALELVIDGTDGKALREALELRLAREEEDGEAPAKVLEAAGGYSPTMGILGAVLGLIHVMENIAEPAKLGGGIAVAFVATVYGVGMANLVLLPLAGKLKLRQRERIVRLEMVLDGVCAIAEGENPRFMERKLAVYLDKGHVVAARRSGARLTPVPPSVSAKGTGAVRSSTRVSQARAQ